MPNTGSSTNPVASEPQDRPGCVGEIKGARAACRPRAPSAESRVGERKRAAHQQRRHADFEQHRPRVVPELGDPAAEWRQTGEALRQSPTMGIEASNAGRRRPSSADTTSSACTTITPARPGRSVDRCSRRAAIPADAGQHDRQDQREHGTKAAEQQREVAEPDDLHAHRRKAAEHKRKAGPSRPGRADGAETWRRLCKDVPPPLASSARVHDSSTSAQRAIARRLRQSRSGATATELRGAQAERGNEREVGQERARRRARGIDGVQHGDLHRAARSTSSRTRCRISSVSVPPISSVIGRAARAAIAPRATYDIVDSSIPAGRIRRI